MILYLMLMALAIRQARVMILLVGPVLQHKEDGAKRSLLIRLMELITQCTMKQMTLKSNSDLEEAPSKLWVEVELC